mmetsp:Transcript_67414/g.161705  ORF Transcript_67414/g.161705 Transcript_67414/m.161705 type:complete len:180 (-) Transcript_67414:131-670(-)|eukprot:CAMPEP_0178403042 /NCGR_PEP_ID=MMETSP0689_2-20121128/17163_1 /TAXON_ID=160604 /ORGANISM="Amphidinium massartii, Strain CS-259" /LENGTH=179 /DNA_ID=CAMNT_0020023981 /DNA_START=106 /DNA_END=645 /DNA_ORIENTATION=-
MAPAGNKKGMAAAGAPGAPVPPPASAAAVAAEVVPEQIGDDALRTPGFPAAPVLAALAGVPVVLAPPAEPVALGRPAPARNGGRDLVIVDIVQQSSSAALLVMGGRITRFIPEEALNTLLPVRSWFRKYLVTAAVGGVFQHILVPASLQLGQLVVDAYVGQADQPEDLSQQCERLLDLI